MERKICVNLVDYFNVDMEKTLDCIKGCGFDGINLGWERNNDSCLKLVNEAKKRNLSIEYVHAPFGRINHFWYEKDETKDDVLDELKECVLFCEQINVDKMVIHTFIGFEEHNPVPCGLTYFEEVLKFAKLHNIKVCFENVEGEEYLAYVVENLFSKYDNAAFCLDTGHELCYNRSKDQLAMYGKYLACTHINDNKGVTKKDIFWHDDLHYVPGDGTMDITNFIERLKKCNYQGNISFELKLNHVFDTPIYEKYRKQGMEKYYERVLEIGKRIKDSL